MDTPADKQPEKSTAKGDKKRFEVKKVRLGAAKGSLMDAWADYFV